MFYLRTCSKRVHFFCIWGTLLLLSVSIFWLCVKHQIQQQESNVRSDLTSATKELAAAKHQVGNLLQKVKSLQERQNSCSCQFNVAGLSQRDRMIFLKEQGFNPENILDIGANQGEWTNAMKLIFPAARFLMLEASARHTESLKKVGVPFVISPVGDVDGRVVTFFTSAKFERAHTGASLFREIGVNGKGNPDFEGPNLIAESVTMRTIDSLVSKAGINGSFHLVKIDVQGAEILALKGASSVLKNTGFVLVEISVSPSLSCLNDLTFSNLYSYKHPFKSIYNAEQILSLERGRAIF